MGIWSNVRGKDNKIREVQQAVLNLQSKIKELELENAKLQGQNETSQKVAVVEKQVL